MSITKLKAAGNWAPPNHDDDHDNKTGRNLNGRVIFGLLTGNEVPAIDVATSAKARRR
jgi:hypothetical protein